MSRIKKRFDINVTEEVSTTPKTFDFDKTVLKIHGVMLTSTREEIMYYCGCMRILINRREIFPEDYEAKLLFSGINVSPNDRYYNLGGIEPGNFKVECHYKFETHPNVGFEPHRISIYFDLEINDEI